MTEKFKINTINIDIRFLKGNIVTGLVTAIFYIIIYIFFNNEKCEVLLFKWYDCLIRFRMQGHVCVSGLLYTQTSYLVKFAIEYAVRKIQ
jgi:hypothetical protein